MKRIISLLLVCTVLVSISIPVFAAQTIDAYGIIEAEYYSEASCESQLGLETHHFLQDCLDDGGGKNIFDFQRNAYFKYSNVDFGDVPACGFSARVADFTDNADLNIILDSIDGEVIGTLHIVTTGKQQDWETQSCAIKPTTGVHDVYLKFENNPATVSLNYFSFLHTEPEEIEITEYSYEPLPVDWTGRDTKPDTWVATDMLGEQVADNQMTGDLREGKYVGIFYHLFLTRKQGDVYDNSQLLELNYFDPAYGPVETDHFWGKPVFDYYRNTDVYVIRRHAQLLYNAGVDVIIFDTSNAGFPFAPYWSAIVDTLYQMRKEGNNTPQIAFHTGDTAENTNKLVQYLYDNLYSQNKYQELWFMWDGKPLMLGNSSTMDAKYKSAFTFRRSWAWQSGQDQWPWLDNTPQGYGWSDSPENPEATSVCLAQHATTFKGKSYSNGVQPSNVSEEETLQLTNFREQWERALELDPEFIFVTAWNEWVASNYYATEGQEFLGRTLSAGDYYFVDEYNAEFSRDIEPSDGFLGDEAYMKLAHYIRLFKGSRAVDAANGEHTILVQNDFSQWDSVEPVYYDTTGDIMHRNELAYAGYTTLVNTTGRNDFATLKTAYDANNIYFYAETIDELTEATDENWMMLFINSDQNSETGWNGYDYVFNHKLLNSNTGLLQRNVGNTWEWEDVASISFKAEGNQIQVAIPRNLIGLDGTELKFQFKWADNINESGNIMDFYNIGDVAPDGRFAYQFYQNAPSVVAAREESINGTDYIVKSFDTYEAEYTERSELLNVEYEHKGFSGIGYAGGFSSVNASLTFYVDRDAEGIYCGKIRYANAQATEKTLSIYVNGKKVNQLVFPVVAPADWTKWGELSFDLPLSAGSNIITIVRDTQDSGGINIDYFGIDDSLGRKFEIEDGVLNIVKANDDKANYSGSGFTENWEELGASATICVNSPLETDYDLEIRYANAQIEAKRLSLYVNGQKIKQIEFPVVTILDWNNWGTVSCRVALKPGENEIMLRYDSGDSGKINVDYLCIKQKDAMWIQAENAELSGGVQINTNHENYVGSGFTDCWTTPGASASFLVPCDATGYFDLIVRYANGEATGRSLTLYVNGTKEQTLQFPVVSGTDWNAWSEICFSKVLKLNKGENTVTLVFDNDNNGKLNVDSIAIK